MKYKLIISLLFMCIIIGNVSAIDYTPHQINTSLKVVVTSNEAIACNLTYVQKPNNSADVFNLPMDASGQTFSKELNGSNFSETGTHCVGIVCYNGADYETGSICREITPNGELADTSKTIFNTILLIILTVFFILALIGLFTVQDYKGKFALYWVCHLLLVAISFIAWRFGADFLFSDGGAGGIFKIIFWVSITAVLPMILLSIAWMVYIHTVTDEMRDMMERGMSPEEAFGRRDNSRLWV